MGNEITYRLGDVCSVINGKAYTQDELLENGKYKVLRVGNFFSNGSWYYSDLELEPEKYCDYGDLLFAWSASFGPKIWNEGKTIYHYHIWKLVLDESKVNKSLLYYILLNRTKSFLSSTHGSIMLHLTKTFMEDLKITVPQNIDTQKRIAAVLSALDAKVELNGRINAELESMAKTLYDYWFVQFEFPNEKGKPYKFAGGKMVWNKVLKREIPLGWEVKKFGEVAAITAGGDKPEVFSLEKNESCSVPIYSNGISNEGLYGYTDKAKIKDKSITVSARGTIGYSVLRVKPFVPIIRLIVITPNIPYSIKYFEEYVKDLEFEKSGSVQQQLTVPQVSKIDVLYPPIDILKNYGEVTSPLISQSEVLKEESQQLAELRDWLLPMLMNGQVTVG